MNTDRLAETFVGLADTLVDDFDLLDFLYTLVDRCMELLDVSAVGLMLVDGRGRLTVMASSSEETRLLELFQLQNDQGPCLEAFRTATAVHSADLQTQTERWPRFAPEAVRANFRAVHALPMRLRSDTIGALNLFHTDPGGLDLSDARIGQALVDVATIGLMQVDLGRRREVLVSQLQTALNTRVAVEQAKGILAERHRTTPAEAFTALRSHARRTNRKLTDLANAVIAGETLDRVGTSPPTD
ncbi:MAG: GAF and ANTAR domain-containing protein [Sporichthyaceae bacterium]